MEDEEYERRKREREARRRERELERKRLEEEEEARRKLREEERAERRRLRKCEKRTTVESISPSLSTQNTPSSECEAKDTCTPAMNGSEKKEKEEREEKREKEEDRVIGEMKESKVIAELREQLKEQEEKVKVNEENCLRLEQVMVEKENLLKKLTRTYEDDEVELEENIALIKNRLQKKEEMLQTLEKQFLEAKKALAKVNENIKSMEEDLQFRENAKKKTMDKENKEKQVVQLKDTSKEQMQKERDKKEEEEEEEKEEVKEIEKHQIEKDEVQMESKKGTPKMMDEVNEEEEKQKLTTEPEMTKSRETSNSVDKEATTAPTEGRLSHLTLERPSLPSGRAAPSDVHNLFGKIGNLVSEEDFTQRDKQRAMRHRSLPVGALGNLAREAISSSGIPSNMTSKEQTSTQPAANPIGIPSQVKRTGLPPGGRGIAMIPNFDPSKIQLKKSSRPVNKEGSEEPKPQVQGEFQFHLKNSSF